jgi:CBS domain-containing protein
MKTQVNWAWGLLTVIARPIEAHAPLKVALRLMATHEIHRVPIVDEEGHLISILTQSSIISQIYHNLSIFSDSHKTVGELGLGYKAKIVAARSTQIAGAAFTTARDHKVSGLAVVDDQNKLVGNISVSDLKTIGYNGQLFKRLFLDVAAFINNRPAVFVTPATSVSEVVRIFHENKFVIIMLLFFGPFWNQTDASPGFIDSTCAKAIEKFWALFHFPTCCVYSSTCSYACIKKNQKKKKKKNPPSGLFARLRLAKLFWSTKTWTIPLFLFCCGRLRPSHEDPRNL